MEYTVVGFASRVLFSPVATSLARDQGHHEGHRDVVDGDAGGDGDISRSGVWGVARPENP